MSAERNALVGRRFGRAVASYDAHAEVQRLAADALAQAIAGLPLPSRPRILEIGCGTGLLTQALARRIGPADWTVTDISGAMLAAARRGPSLPGSARFMQLDGEYPEALAGERFDLIVSSLAVQWFDDLDAGLSRLCALLEPGGHLAIATLAEGTFEEWRQAHRELGLAAATPRYPPAASIGHALPRMRGGVDVRTHVQRHANGLAFLRGLKAIGAVSPAAGTRPLRVADLRHALARFDRGGAAVSYQLAYGIWRRDTRPPRGVFVTGTDTGIGKTLVSAVLARAWQADYWKPLQTGVAEEPGDTETVARLAQLPPGRLHAPAYVLQAPLSPWAAARLEGVTIDAAAIEAPSTEAPLVVEGAGGLFVPIDESYMMIDLARRLGLPVVLVARSTLGTINHTLLSLQALRRYRVPVAGVILSGPLSPGNKDAIERFGQVRVLAEIPALGRVDADAVTELARGIPALQDCLDAAGG